MPAYQASWPSLEEPISYRAIIEEPLRTTFPGVWEGLYYFDPQRGYSAEQEANNVYQRVRHSFNVTSLRGLDRFNTDILFAIKNGGAKIIPFSLANRRLAYLMTETEIGEKRLKDFFGPETVRNTGRLNRLFEDFAARHEMFHAVQILEPGFDNPHASESTADSYAILSMLRDYGPSIHDFAEQVIAARDYQYARDAKSAPIAAAKYLTQNAVRNTLEFAAEKGGKALQALPPREIFLTAGRLAGTKPQALTA